MTVPPPFPSTQQQQQQQQQLQQQPPALSDNERLRRKLEDPKAWERLLFHKPCVKSSYLWGIGIGACAFAHKLRLYPGKLRHAFNAAFITFLITSTLSFGICSTESNRRRQTLQEAFQKQVKRKE